VHLYRNGDVSSLAVKFLSLNHAPDTARTCNLQFRRLSLYPVELRVLSIAEVDHMAHPGFGKAKMQWLEPMRNVSACRRGGRDLSEYRRV
jgi:hypothetical protein